LIDEYYVLLIIIFLAFITPLIFNRINVPSVVGEILFGLAAGAVFFLISSYTGEPILGENSSVSFLAHIGFIFLMFLSGLELDFARLERGGKDRIWLAVAAYVLCLLMVYPMVILVSEWTTVRFDPLFISLILSTTAIAVVLSVVREMRLSRTDYGQTLIVVALVADVAAMLLMTIYAIMVDVQASDDLFYALLALLVSVVILGFFLMVFRIGSWSMWRFPETIKRFFRYDDPNELGVRASLTIVFTFVAISTVIGSEALTVLGAFMAGAVISMLFQNAKVLEQKLYGIGYGFLVPIFFINIGITFDFEAVMNAEALLLIPVLFLVMVVAKLLPFIILSRGQHLRRNITNGILMTGGLTLMIAGAEIGRGLDLVDEASHGLIILLAVIFAVVSPTLFKRMHPRLGLEAKP
jgi:CPA2 family monovalent cation:H+ antiporter-2